MGKQLAYHDRWSALVRQGIRLTRATDDDVAVGYLGGCPTLPVEHSWPATAAGEPMSLVAAIDCAAIYGGEIDFPDSGWLLFFHLYSNGWSSEEAQVQYIPRQVATSRRPAPEGVHQWPQVLLSARPVETLPLWPNPILPLTFAAGWTDTIAGSASPETWTNDSDLTRQIDQIGESSQELLEGHRLGGYPCSIQGAVEYEVMNPSDHGRIGTKEYHAEAARWRLLAQIDSDDAAHMMWGDSGMLYWMIRPEDLAARRFDQARFAWQCC